MIREVPGLFYVSVSLAVTHGQWHSLCRIQGSSKDSLAHSSLEGGTALIIGILHLHACALGRLVHDSDTVQWSRSHWSRARARLTISAKGTYMRVTVGRVTDGRLFMGLSDMAML